MLKGLLNNTLTQIVVYNLVGQLVGAVIGPYAQAITNQVNAATPLVPLSPAEAAALVIRGEWGEDAAAAEAAMSGIDRDRFHRLVRLSGEAPGPVDLAVALRRGLIDKATYDRGIAEGNLRTEWGDLVRQLAVQEPSPIAILQAYLEGQIPEAKARQLYARLGGAPEYFEILYNSQGSSPTPLEAAEMARRGVIPWDGTGPDATSYEQAFLEGPWRNKWSEPFRTLAQYLPPPRTVTAMYREGSLTKAQASKYLAQGGLPPDLVQAYLSSGSEGKTAGTKDLARTTILALYQDQLIKRSEAADMLQGQGYDADEADYMLAVEDLRLAQRFLGLAVGRVHTLYVGRKISKAQALDTLHHLEITGDQAGQLMSIWDWERAADVKLLTPSEIYNGWKAKLLDLSEALSRLTDLGYTPRDAWLYMSIHNKAAVDGAPPSDDTTTVGP